MIATFHNHSKWSDGQSSFAEIYAHANSIGVETLGLSDHFCVYPDNSSPTWSLHPNKVSDYLEDVLSYRGRGRMKIRVGLEFDWFEDHRKVIAPFVESISLDYRIGAIHHVEGQQFDVDALFWTAKTWAEQDEVWIKYWIWFRGWRRAGYSMSRHTLICQKTRLQSPRRPRCAR